MPRPYKSLVLCFDGTWNTLDSNTNVSRLYSEVADVSTGWDEQLKFYDEGVGTQWYDRIRGGAFGAGLDKNIRMGYAWLCSVYESAAADAPIAKQDGNATRKSNGDLVNAPPHSSKREFLTGSDIYIFGFSRGAFTARSLGGMINYLGLPKIDLAKIDPEKTELADHPEIQNAWNLYATRPGTDVRKQIQDGSAPEGVKSLVAKYDKQLEAFRTAAGNRYPVRIHFMGVWDTVGALGIPRIFDKDWIPRFSSKYQFHDTALCEGIRNAFHAVAIDEQRLPYKATLWTEKQVLNEQVEQRWFPGAHADVGGGYKDDLLPAPPLKWLVDQAAACGLQFVNDRKTVGPDEKPLPSVAVAPAAFNLDGNEYLSPLHDSYAEFFGGVYRAVRSVPGMGGRVYRRMLVLSDGINQKIDETAFLKWKADPEYRPPNLGQAGRADVTFNVARDDLGNLMSSASFPVTERPGRA